jgi:hypothetical protein
MNAVLPLSPVERAVADAMQAAGFPESFWGGPEGVLIVDHTGRYFYPREFYGGYHLPDDRTTRRIILDHLAGVPRGPLFICLEYWHDGTILSISP